MTDKTTMLKNRLKELKTFRGPWENLWQEVAKYVNPKRGDFSTIVARGTKRTQLIYDGTAPWALNQFAAGLHGFLTSPTQRWFTLRTLTPGLDEDPDLKLWLELVTDLLFEEVFNSPATRWMQQSHEHYLDIGSWGTAIMFMDDRPGGPPIQFKAWHLDECFIAENDDGFVDTLYRVYKRTSKQLFDRFGNEGLPADLTRSLSDNPLKEWELLHAIYPREQLKFDDAGVEGMAFASDLMLIEKKVILEEGGYREFPAAVPRWYKVVGETYGRSPATEVLPDIKTVNEMMKTTIKGAQKMVDPPMQMPDDGFLLPVKMAPGSINYYRAGSPQTDRIASIETGGKPDIGLEMINDRRDHIVRAFFADLMQMQQKLEMTATEVLQRQEDRMRLIAPMVGRMQTESLSPIIERVYNVMVRRGRIPEPPIEVGSLRKRVSSSSTEMV